MKSRYSLLCLLLLVVCANAVGQTYQYDLAGRLTYIAYPDGNAVHYEYDDRDNLTAIVPATVPTRPTNVTVTRSGFSEVDITWEQSTPAAGFIVEYRTAGSAKWQPLILFPITPETRTLRVELPDPDADAVRVTAVGEADFGGPPVISVPSLAAVLPFAFPLTVTTLLDENDHALGRGIGDSLREVLEEAAPGDTIRFGAATDGGPGDTSPLLEENLLFLKHGQLRIDKDITIDASNYPLPITISAEGKSRVLAIGPDAVVTVNNLRLVNGAANTGAGLFNDGSTVTLINTSIENNEATDSGGGIHNENGSITLMDGNVGLNRAVQGGGIYNHLGSVDISFSALGANQTVGSGSGIMNVQGIVSVDSSTFILNAAGSTGAIATQAGTTTVVNSTFSSNSALFGAGGAIANLGGGQTTLRHTTIAASIGGGVYNETGSTLFIDNTIIANNIDLNNKPADVSGDFTAIGASLVRIHEGALLGGPAPLTDDPLLEELGVFGGATLTMPLRAGSPAIDAGVTTANTPQRDQQYAPRVNGPRPDLGSMESRLSSESLLDWLTTDAGPLLPAFRPGNPDYSVTVPYSKTTAAIRPGAGQPDQTMEARINGGSFSPVFSNTASSEFSLSAGENLIEVKVTAQNGTTISTYNLTVIRSAPSINDSSLSSLTTSAGSLTPSFTSNTFSYYGIVAQSVASMTVSATPTTPGASMEVRTNFGAYVPVNSNSPSPPLALRQGTNSIDIRVTSVLGGNVSTYTLFITREPAAIANAHLVSLATSAGTLSPTFSRGRYVYDVTTASSTATVTAIAAQTGTSLGLRINDGNLTPLNSGAASSPINLQTGLNVIEVEATALDNQTTLIYTLIVTRFQDGIEVVSKKGTSMGDETSEFPSVSSDGRFIAFSSRASNLVDDDNAFEEDIFVYDVATKTIERISAGFNGDEANDASSRPSISADGRYVAYQSEATNLVPNDFNGDTDRSRGKDIFVHDRQTGTTERISLTRDGGEANQFSESPSISGDGRYVAFVSGANNLIPEYENGEFNVYVYDRTDQTLVGVPVPTGQYEVDTNGSGQDAVIYTANLNSLNPAVSANGKFVAFEFSVDKSVGNTPGYQYRDIYLYGRDTGVVQRITGIKIGLAADGADSRAPAISADGRFVAFHSNLEGLDFFDTNTESDVFLYDRLDGSIRLVSAKPGETSGNFRPSANASISADGRVIAFESLADSLADSDNNFSSDVFLKEMNTGEVRVLSRNAQGTLGDADSLVPAISGDARLVAFQSLATNLTNENTDFVTNVFLSSRNAIPASSLTGLDVLASNLGATQTGPDAFTSGIPESIDTAILRPLLADPDATVQARPNGGSFVSPNADGVFFLPLNPGDNTIDLKITSADGSASRTITIAVSRVFLSSNASLASLSTTLGDISPSLDDNVVLYTLAVPNARSAIRVLPTAADPTASILVNGSTVISGTQSSSISLPVGATTITIQVVAEDGLNLKTTALTVFRLPANDDLIDDVQYESETPSTIRVSWFSLPGATYRIEKSLDLKNWEVIETGIPADDIVSTIDIDFMADQDRSVFFRIVEE